MMTVNFEEKSFCHIKMETFTGKWVKKSEEIISLNVQNTL